MSGIVRLRTSQGHFVSWGLRCWPLLLAARTWPEDRMPDTAHIGDARTSVDGIYAVLEAEILSLKLRPGDKLSEADVAARFGVSRQPVRDAFNRLASYDLLVIRPKRATEVKRFSAREIEKARFVRAAVEERVLKRAAQYCDLIGAARLDMAIAEQEDVLETKALDRFVALDNTFHEIICHIARAEFAFDVIAGEKAKVDRLCMLSLSKEDRMPDLIADHREMAEGIKANDADRAVTAGMRHLSRLDLTIKDVSEKNADYFADT